MYTNKEAVLSIQIEGTSSLSSELLDLLDLLLLDSKYENSVEGKAEFTAVFKGALDVVRYLTAMEHGLTRIRGGFPISLRLIREIHEKLLYKSKGGTKQIGEFRRSQNWIGGTRPGNAQFVPPPPGRILDLMSDLEAFIHADTPKVPLLIKVGLVHAQFETIHPFLDGNGRLGRLLITLLLCDQGLLKKPVLYLSLYFKTHRQHYYDLLQQVRRQGDWETWLEFFLEGITEISLQAVKTAHEIRDLFEDDRGRIEGLGYPAALTLHVYEILQKMPTSINISEVAQKAKISIPAVTRSLQNLEKLGILRKNTEERSVPVLKFLPDRPYVYERYWEILRRGT